MTDIKKIAKIVLVAAALYVLTGLLTISVGIAVAMFSAEHTLPLLTIAYLGPVALIMATCLCLFGSWGDKVAEKVVGKTKPPTQPVWWLPAMLRLACVVAGIWYLYWSLPGTLYFLQQLVWDNFGAHSDAVRQALLSQIARNSVVLALGLYLLFGAPHFVRWQVKKTIQQCKKLSSD